MEKLELRELTPEDMQCSYVIVCPAIYSIREHYLIIGEQVNPKEFGLERKLGKGEVLIKVEKRLIDNKKE